MDVCDTCIPRHLCGRRVIPLSYFEKVDAQRVPLVRHFAWPFRQRQSIQNSFMVDIWLGTFSRSVYYPLMAVKEGSENANIRRQKSCKVQWNLEAEIEDGQELYLSGSITSLGCWEPQLAIPLSACEGQPNLWRAEIQIPRGTSLQYNYFVQGGRTLSDDITWRPGPMLCLAVPSSGRLLKKKIVVQDSWVKITPRKLPVLSWGTWWEDIGPPGQPGGFLGFECSTVDDSIAEHSNLYNVFTSYQLVDTMSRSGLANICDLSKDLASQRIENEASLEWAVPQEVLGRKDTDFSRECRILEDQENDGQPVEEPWLLGGSILVKEENVVVAKSEKDLQITLQTGHEAQTVEAPSTKEGIGMVLQKEKDVVTEIVINSSVCTMQRIAILEDGKLVELLLEPVKTNVQVGSVYLGVVKKLLPQMSGAFVDIGSTRLALMEISKNKEPYAFPSWDSLRKKKESNGALTDSPGNESSSKAEDFHEFLEGDIQEDEISMMYEDAEDEQEVIEEELEESDNLAKGQNNCRIDVNSISTANMEAGYYLNGNGHETEEETDGEHYINGGYSNINNKKQPYHQSENMSLSSNGPRPVKFARKLNKWMHVREGTKIIVQVNKEELGTKGPQISAYPTLTSRFWVLAPRINTVGVSRNISGVERTRLRLIAKTLQPPDVGLTVRTVAAGRSFEELEKDLKGLLQTWKEIVEHAKSAVLAAEEGVEGAVPVILHRAMGQTLSVVQDDFNDKVQRMVVDSPRTYHEVTSYLEEVAPTLCNRVELYTGKNPIFDEFGVETEIDNFLSKRVPLPNGGYLVIEQTEALVSIDVNGGSGMLGRKTSHEQAILEVNLVAARQIARELRLRDIGGIIVVDFIDMTDDKHKRMVYEEIKKAVERDRSSIKFSEISELGLMEMTRKRVRPSVTFMISEPCLCCHANGRVEALKTTFSKIERAIRRLLARRVQKAKVADGRSWLRILLRVDPIMSDYLTSGKRTRLAQLSSSLKVWIVLKVTREYERGQFEVNDSAKKNTPDKQNQVAITGTNTKRIHSNALGKKLRIWPFKRKMDGTA